MEILDRIEENGLDKLIKLLTEHCRKHYGFKDNDDIEIDTDSICFHLYHKGERYFPIKIETVICKDFGFIKWLVDNDKIDFRKLDPKINDSIPTRYYLGNYIRYSFEKEILMTLSISNTPIEDLISYLK